MEFTDFTKLVKNEVEKRAGDGYSIQLAAVPKNNGTTLCGIMFLQENCNISPTVYLDGFYDAYWNGTASLGMITDRVMDIYGESKISRNIDLKNFLDYEAVRHHIVYKLINTERNRALLGEIPHLHFHDLSIVFEWLVTNENIGSASILINNAHMKRWDVDTAELYRAASVNTPNLRKYVLKNMKDVVTGMAGVMDFGEAEDAFPMYVLSNGSDIDGAACILYPNLLRDFARAAQSDLFIIPSSVHETLILPYGNPGDIGQLKDIIREVNENEVAAEEVLSDSLYVYERCTDVLRML